MIRRFHRAISLAATGLLLAVTGIIAMPITQQDAEAANAADFRPGMLISDAKFYDRDSMTVDQIQQFLNEKGRNCTSNCLKDYRINTQDRPATEYCRAYRGARGETAAQVIEKVGEACGISPKVLLVMLEKETSLVSMSNPGAWRYDRAMGYYCPDDPSRPGWCHPDYAGIFNQLYYASSQLQRYAAYPQNYGYVAGRTNSILYNPNSSCGASNVYIENQATASLYIYTPYQPNRAALNNLYGTGDGCSAYGNRNFWRMYTDWFGSTSGSPAPTNTRPTAHLDAVVGQKGAVGVMGWAVDPDKPTAKLDVEVKIDGKSHMIQTGWTREDIAKHIPGAGSRQGFITSLPATAGERKVCVTVRDSTSGGPSRSLGCRTVTVQPKEPEKPVNRQPVARLYAVVGQKDAVGVMGWAVDPDDPTAKLDIDVKIDDKNHTISTGWTRPNVKDEVPGAGDRQGFITSLKAVPGERRVCITARDSAGGKATNLGCHTVNVETSNTRPIAHLDGVVGQREAVGVLGWAVDPDDPDAKLDVEVRIDGKSHVISTGWTRPDVQRHISGSGPKQGFITSLPASVGEHRVCVTVRDHAGGVGTNLGCRTVTSEAKPEPRTVTARTSSSRSLSVVPEKEAPQTRRMEAEAAPSSSTLTVVPIEPEAESETEAEVEPEAKAEAKEEQAAAEAASAADEPHAAAAPRMSMVEPEPEVQVEPTAEGDTVVVAEEAVPTEVEESAPAPAAVPPAPAQADGTQAGGSEADGGETSKPEPLTVVPIPPQEEEPTADAGTSAGESSEEVAAGELATTGNDNGFVYVLIALGTLLMSAGAMVGVRQLRED